MEKLRWFAPCLLWIEWLISHRKKSKLSEAGTPLFAYFRSESLDFILGKISDQIQKIGFGQKVAGHAALSPRDASCDACAVVGA